MSSVQIRFLFHYFFCSCLNTDKAIVRVLGYGAMWQQLTTTLDLRIYHPGFVNLENTRNSSQQLISNWWKHQPPLTFSESHPPLVCLRNTHICAHTNTKLLKGALLWPLCRTDCGLSPLFNGKLKRSSLPSASCMSLSVCAHRESRS